MTDSRNDIPFASSMERRPETDDVESRLAAIENAINVKRAREFTATHRALFIVTGAALLGLNVVLLNYWRPEWYFIGSRYAMMFMGLSALLAGIVGGPRVRIIIALAGGICTYLAVILFETVILDLRGGGLNRGIFYIASRLCGPAGVVVCAAVMARTLFPGSRRLIIGLAASAVVSVGITAALLITSGGRTYFLVILFSMEMFLFNVLAVASCATGRDKDTLNLPRAMIIYGVITGLTYAAMMFNRKASGFPDHLPNISLFFQTAVTFLLALLLFKTLAYKHWIRRINLEKFRLEREKEMRNEGTLA